MSDKDDSEGSCYMTKCNTRIGTWNVRTMNEKGKLENVKCEMRRNGLSILGLSEVRWREGEFDSDGFKVIYSGGVDRQ